MNLDVNTLFLVTIYVEAILGLLLLFAWAQNTAITAVAWWGFAHLLRAASVTLFGLYGSVSDLISIDLANAILFTSFARDLDGRAPVRSSQAAIRAVVRRRRAVARRLPDSGLHRFPRPARAVVVRHYHRLYLGRGVRILARPRRASGFALARDLHAVRARRALFAAHAAGRLAAVAHRATIRCWKACGSRRSASRGCCSPSRSPSFFWRWRRSAPSIARRPRR